MTERDEAIRARCVAAQGLWGSVGNLAGFAEHAREDIPYLLDRVETLESALAEAQRRAEAAVEDMWTMRSCQSCLHQPEGYPSLHGACKDCDDEDKWEWRGPVAENAELPVGRPVASEFRGPFDKPDMPHATPEQIEADKPAIQALTERLLRRSVAENRRAADADDRLGNGG